MKFLKPVLIALLCTPYFIALVLLPFSALAAIGVLVLVPLLVALALPFARWDDEPSIDSNGQGLTIRGDLPTWAAWLATPDERLPGGTYEPAVAGVLARYGRWVCSWYWIGVRNQLHGLSAVFGVPVVSPWPVEPGYYTDGSLWWLRRPLLGGRLQLKAGYRTYWIRGAFVAVPACSITRA